MSLLWTTAMPWHQMPDDAPRTPLSVRHSGFAGYVGPGDNEELKDMTMPSMSPSEMQHIEEHDAYPSTYKQRHRDRYEKAKANLTDEDMPDVEDPRLFHFMRHQMPKTQGNDWDYAYADLTRPVYATQSHVAKEHIERYKNNPDSPQHWTDKTSVPLMVTHEGRTHVADGHHRVAAGIARGETEMPVFHLNLDRHYVPGYDDEDHQ